MSDFSWLKEAIDKIEKKVDVLDEKLGEQNITLTKQATVLDEHIKRTEIAEENISLLRKDFQPIQKHVDNVKFIFEVIGFIALVVGCLSGIFAIFQYVSTLL